MYPTHQFTRHSPGISGHHRPWLQSLTAQQTLMPVLPLSLSFAAFYQSVPKSLDLCPADSCIFSFTTQLLLFLSFTAYLSLSLSLLTHFLGFSLSLSLSLFQNVRSSETLESLAAPQWFSPEMTKEHQLKHPPSSALVMCVLL